MNDKKKYYWLDEFGGVNGPDEWPRLQELRSQNMISDEAEICVVGDKNWLPYRTADAVNYSNYTPIHNDKKAIRVEIIPQSSQSSQNHSGRTVFKRVILASVVTIALAVALVYFFQKRTRPFKLTFTDDYSNSEMPDEVALTFAYVYSNSEIPVEAAITQYKPDFVEVYYIARLEILIMSMTSQHICKQYLDEWQSAINSRKNVSNSLGHIFKQNKFMIDKLLVGDRNLRVLMRYLRSPPEEYKEATHALDEYYLSSQQLLSLATNPKGSLFTYNQRFEKASDASNRFDALVRIKGCVANEIDTLLKMMQNVDVDEMSKHFHASPNESFIMTELRMCFEKKQLRYQNSLLQKER